MQEILIEKLNIDKTEERYNEITLLYGNHLLHLCMFSYNRFKVTLNQSNSHNSQKTIYFGQLFNFNIVRSFMSSNGLINIGRFLNSDMIYILFNEQTDNYELINCTINSAQLINEIIFTYINKIMLEIRQIGFTVLDAHRNNQIQNIIEINSQLLISALK